jgi:hypothetical protein
VSKSEFETYAKHHDRTQNELRVITNSIDTLKDTVKSHKFDHDQQMVKMREMQDSVYKMENVHIPAMNTRLNQMATQDENHKVRTDLEEKVCIT